MLRLLVIWPLLAFSILVSQGQDYNENGLDCWDVCVFEASDNAESQRAV
jgi:hypothetical protein